MQDPNSSPHSNGWLDEHHRLAHPVNGMGSVQPPHGVQQHTANGTVQPEPLHSAAYSQLDRYPSHVQVAHRADHLIAASDDGHGSPYAAALGHESGSQSGTPNSRVSFHEDMPLTSSQLGALSLGPASSPRCNGVVGSAPSMLQHQRSGGSLRQLQSGLARTSSMVIGWQRLHLPEINVHMASSAHSRLALIPSPGCTF